jgi:beta-xylosidase
MKRNYFIVLFFFVAILFNAQTAKYPLIFADVPEMSMVHVGDTYYNTGGYTGFDYFTISGEITVNRT